MERLTYIDSLKGIGIILVVIGHWFSPYTYYLDDPINQMIYSFHMPLFFFLSGLVYVYSYKQGFKLFVLKKFLSLIIPYLGFSALFCFITKRSWISLLIDNELHDGYWFTLTLFIVLILGYVIDLILPQRIQRGGQLLVCVSLIVIAKLELLPDWLSAIISFDKVAKFYLYFLLGKFVMQDPRIKRIMESDLTYTLLLCLYVFVFCIYGYTLDSVNGFSFLLAICGVFVIYNVVLKNSKFFNAYGFLPFLGQKSLEIYLVHFLFLEILSKDLVDGYGMTTIQVLLLAVFSFVVICLSLTVSYFICNSDILSFILFGKGKYAKRLINKISFHDN